MLVHYKDVFRELNEDELRTRAVYINEIEGYFGVLENIEYLSTSALRKIANQCKTAV